MMDPAEEAGSTRSIKSNPEDQSRTMLSPSPSRGELVGTAREHLPSEILLCIHVASASLVLSLG
jgi:hypothetical protein